ncbi:MAG: GntP family permease [Bacteroidota bacterium]
MILLLVLFVSVGLLILASTRYNLHPFLALLGVTLLFGLAAGVPFQDLLNAIGEGFGGTIGKVGIIILLGVMIGTILEKTGGIYALASFILKIIGDKLVNPAMGIMGYIVSIPVFGDSGFIILLPLARALAKKVKKSFIGPVVALALGLTCTHSLVPPTPGPIAAAGILEADLGSVILYGILVSSITLVVCILYASYIAPKMKLVMLNPDLADADAPIPLKTPPAWKAFLPIIIPLILIVLKSVAEYPTHPFGVGKTQEWLLFIGNPVIALIIGFFISLLLPKKLDKRMLSSTGWMGPALRDAAVIIIITGAGGAFGKVIQQSPLADTLAEMMSGTQAGILLPFLLAAGLKTAQGSSTVALITTASILAPLLGTLGLDGDMERVMTVLSIGAGATFISHANDSFFWIFTQMTGMDVGSGYRIHSLGTFILGTTAGICIFLLNAIL